MDLGRVKKKTITFGDSLKTFHLKILDFLSPKLVITDHFTRMKGSIC